MTIAAWFVLCVIGAALLLMMLEVAPPDLVLLGAAVLLAVSGVLEPEEALAGFSNTGMLAVAALFVVAAGLGETGAVGLVTERLLGRPQGPRSALVRLIGPTIVASAFLNNTAIVATLMPAVHDWSRRIGIPRSHLLMPLSFAAILGGVCTLVGTSTNLVVAGLVRDRLGAVPGLHEIGMFEIAPLGIPVALAGAVVLVLGAPLLLPDRTPAVSADDDLRRYTMELIVPARSRLAGRTIEEAGLRHLPGGFLMDIVRGEHVIEAVDAGQPLEEGDRLVFVGDLQAMVELQRTIGLAAAPDQVGAMAGERQERRIVEAVVSQRNPLVGRTIRDGMFRSRYHAVVIAVAHRGERYPGRIGDVVLEPGDVLLLEASPQFLAEQRSRNDFWLVSPVEGAAPPRFERAGRALAVLAALLVVVAAEILPMVTAAWLAAGVMVLARCCTVDEARRSLDLGVLVAIASAFALGVAMERTGLAARIADGVVALGADDPRLALLAVYVATALLTELITNNAAAVLALPIALSLSERLGVQPMAFVFSVTVAASASFLTPIGYQTNLMVYGPGGYRAFDYPRLGLPLALSTAVVTMVLAPILWPL